MEYKFSAETADVEKYYIVFNVATLVYIYLYSYIVWDLKQVLFPMITQNIKGGYKLWNEQQQQQQLIEAKINNI